MEGLADRLAKIAIILDDAHLVLPGGVDHAEHAVIGRDEILSRGFGQDRPARRPHAGVHDDHVHGLLRKIRVRLRDQECGLADLVGAHLMAQIHDARGRRDSQYHALRRELPPVLRKIRNPAPKR